MINNVYWMVRLRIFILYMQSNHPVSIINHIPKGIKYKQLTNLSNINIFNKVKDNYEKALNSEGHKNLKF